MNAPKSPRGPSGSGSLIERAADTYGLGAFARTPRPAPPHVVPEPPAAFVERRMHAAVTTAPPAAAPREVAPSVAVSRPAPLPVAAHATRESASPTPFVSSEVEKREDAKRFSTALEANGEVEAVAQGQRPAAQPAPARAPAPVTRTDAVRIDRAKLAADGMIVPGAAVSVLAEEFRLVKRQLLLTARSLRDDPAKARTILICSARPNEGKTFCAINLGISLAAERDTEVLLIDGDFAKRDLMPRLGLANGQGFLDALADPALDAERLVVPTDIPQLSLLAAGTRTNDDTELLASDRTRQVIARLLAADPRRILIFDTPPVLAASPASVFALHAGQVMMVVRADATSENEIRDAVGLLDGCEHIQLALNQVRHRPGGYRFGEYYAPVENAK